jgi:glutamine---fructose-6-phosphate transaminase (isomerizing)
MCGIVGYVGNRSAVEVLLKGLQRLEYRGYDSTGVAFQKGNRIEIEKSEGKLENIFKRFKEMDLNRAPVSTVGIGHTRWATHGKPTTQNAHPHRTGSIVLVHNGIIENYREIKEDLMKKGHEPQSETDSELFGFLVLEELKLKKSFIDAVRFAFQKLEGACSVVVMSENDPDTVIGIRNGSPLVAGIDSEGAIYLASDPQPLLDYTKKVVYLENGDMAIAKRSGLEFRDVITGKVVQRETIELQWSVEQIDKQGYPHFMLKEIYEQPTALIDTFNSNLDRIDPTSFPLAKHPGVDKLMNASELHLIACGTSYYASLVGKYWLEKYARVSTQVEFASEFRYRDPVLDDRALIVGVSQSGETADTLAVLRDLKKKGKATAAVSNVRGSTISRETDGAFFTSAGPEIGVAATKSFLTQMGIFLLWTGAFLERRKKGSADGLFEETVHLPHVLKNYLDDSSGIREKIKEAARATVTKKGFFFIGRGSSYPLALEGALKLKEIAYVHAEGYAAGELKHGPIAMIDENVVVIVLAPKDGWRDKTISNLEEVKARGAQIIGVGDPSDRHLQDLSHHFIPLPTLKNEDLNVFPLSIVVQLFSYELATLKGTDIDKPRNLAKSVTVE